MEKVTLKEFCELAECSKQLIAVYVAKGMPKHPHPENKRKNLFDLQECREWAIEKGLKSFEKKVDKAGVKLNCKPLDGRKFKLFEDDPVQPNHFMFPCTAPEFKDDFDSDLEHGEGSTAAPLIVTVDPFLELERRFSALTKQMEVCMTLARRGK